MDHPHRARVLCVDDEASILKGLELYLRRGFEVLTATSGQAALDLLEQHADVVAVLSDMRMPGMDGAALLREVRERYPDVVRVMLTGNADVSAAVSAVNEGQVFRFLTKPCPTPELVRVMEAAVEQHRLVTTERVLLEQTLHGSLKALLDVLALANPESFGHASRVKALVTQLADRLDLPMRWQVEVAAMLAPLGWISLPPETQEALLRGRPLEASEAAMVRRLPGVTDALLKNIPRLDGVRAMIRAAADDGKPLAEITVGDPVLFGAGILRVAADFDLMTARGDATRLALEAMQGRSGRYPPGALGALRTVVLPGATASGGSSAPVLHEIPMRLLSVGMVLAEDLRTEDGVLLAARGYEVSLGLVERAANLPETKQRQAVRVLVPPGASEEILSRQRAIVGDPSD
ncbi:MAG: response regulator [Gemmatimonadales bacterium]